MLDLLYHWHGLNNTLFLALNGLRGPVVDGLMLAGSRLGDLGNAAWLAAGLSGLVALHWLPAEGLRRRLPEREALLALLLAFLLAFALGAALVMGGKTAFDMPRPFAALPAGSVHQLTFPKEPYSLPSGHAAFAMLVASVLWPRCRPGGRAALLLAAVWVGLARINLGAHFPADVVAGWLCGGLSGVLGNRIAAGWRHGRRAREAAGSPADLPPA